jgi:uncharacterized membrane-anchored protein
MTLKRGTVAIGCGDSTFARLLPRETYEEVYRDGPDVIRAGSAQPVGTAEATADGWRVRGASDDRVQVVDRW